MSARPPRQAPEALRTYPAKPRGQQQLDALQDAVANLHPLHRQHAVELHRQQQQQVRASLSTFTACTVPASCRARSRFLNLRDSVKKSPTKSTAKVVGGGQRRTPWIPTNLPKVPPSPVPLLLLLVCPSWMLVVAWWKLGCSRLSLVTSCYFGAVQVLVLKVLLSVCACVFKG